jgi:hypothetical protein
LHAAVSLENLADELEPNPLIWKWSESTESVMDADPTLSHDWIDPSRQKVLIVPQPGRRSVINPGAHHWLDLEDRGVLATPHSTWHRRPVAWMIAHDVEWFCGLKPFVDSGSFALG